MGENSAVCNEEQTARRGNDHSDWHFPWSQSTLFTVYTRRRVRSSAYPMAQNYVSQDGRRPHGMATTSRTHVGYFGGSCSLCSLAGQSPAATTVTTAPRRSLPRPRPPPSTSCRQLHEIRRHRRFVPHTRAENICYNRVTLEAVENFC